MTKTALITGGQQGIGFGIAQALYEAGWRVIVTADHANDTPSVQQAMAALPGASYHQHDLADIDRLDVFFDTIGPFECLVSNAGVPAMVRGDMLNMAPDSFDRCLNINLRGTFFFAQAAARRMLATPAGVYRSMLFVTSVSADVVSPDRAEYCMSKAGAAMMVKAFAARLAPHNIGVFELRPGIIATPMTAPVADRYNARISDGLVPAARWGQPRDLGTITVPLVEGAFAFATGAVIPVDGGLSIPRL